MENIHPIFGKLLTTEEKEKLLKQRGIVIWLVGLSGSGKSTLARALEMELHSRGYFTMLLDGDNLRTGINKNLGFSESDRLENIRRTSEVAKLFANCGVVTICSLISPTEEVRLMARAAIGEKYSEVFIDCPLKVCEERDVKGLYAEARSGEIPNFTGIDSPFDPPSTPDLKISTHTQSIEESLKELLEFTLDKIENS